MKFIITGLLWLAILFCLPMLISGKAFILQSYADWYYCLAEKNSLNISLAPSQDMSIMGIVRHVTNNPAIPNTPFLLFGAIVFLLCFFRFSQYHSLKFRMYILSSALLMVVLFSTGSETPTYIIAVTGAMIWLFLQEKPFSAGNIILLIALLLITGLGATDAIPKIIRRTVVVPYRLNVWPCAIVWLIMSYEMLFKRFMDPEFIISNKMSDKNILTDVST